MSTGLYQAFVEVIPESRGLRAKLAKEFDIAGGDAGKSAGKGIHSGILGSVGGLAVPLATAFAALGIGKILSDSISNASDVAEAGGAISAIFGGASSSINTFAGDASKAFGLSQIESLNAAKTFGIFGNAAGLTADANASFANEFTGLAADLAAFNNTDSQTAIDALGAAFRGESEPMSQFGVLLNEATLKARAMEMGIYDGNGALTSQQKLLATQAEILAQTATQQGNFGDTSAGLAGQQKIFETGVANLSATFGAMLLPIMTTVVEFMNSSIIPAFRDVSVWVSDNIGLLKGVGLALGVTAGAWLVMTGVLTAFNGIMAIVRAVTLAGSVAQWALNVAMSASPIGIIIVALAALVGGIVWVATQTTFFQDAWAAMVDIFVSSMGMFSDFFTNTIGMFSDFFSNTVGMFVDFGAGVVAFISGFWAGMKSTFATAIAFLLDLFFKFHPLGILISNFDAIVAFLKSAMGNIGKAVSTGIDSAITFFADLPGKAVSALGNLGSTLLGSGKSLIQGFIDGISGMLGKVGDAVGGVMDFVAGFFPNSPAKHGPLSGAGWRKILTSGTAIGTALSDGLKNSIPDLDSMLSSSVNVGAFTPRVDASVYGSAVGAGSANSAIYVQNPFTGEYLLAQVGEISHAQIMHYDAVEARTIRRGLM